MTCSIYSSETVNVSTITGCLLLESSATTVVKQSRSRIAPFIGSPFWSTRFPGQEPEKFSVKLYTAREQEHKPKVGSEWIAVCAGDSDGL
jgi:hypothetical protein